MRPLAHARGRRRRLEWALLAVLLLALVAWLSPPQALPRANHMVQDLGLRWMSRPAHPDIVVVAIDDRSIATIGRWPWRRALHAELIRQISAQGPRVIGLDVLLGEEDLDYPADDWLLADALQRSGRVVLPVMRRNDGVGGSAADMPLPAFARAAARLGHVHVSPDVDGVVRRLYMAEGSASAPWPHFSAAMQCVAGALPAPQCPAAQGQAAPRDAWVRSDPSLIAYAGGAARYATYSYIDVLRGQVPPGALRGKYVLVGAAATGLGDLFATPVGQPSHLMPGVEVVAQVLDGRLSGVHIREATPAVNAAFNLVPVACALLALLLLGPSAALLTTAVLALATALLALALPWGAGVQVAPAAAFVGLVLAYPLWSWRRLSAAAYFLRQEMEHLQHEGLAMRRHERLNDPGDFLERRINAVERATRQLRDLHHFVSQSLQQLPAPTFICDPDGRILLCNQAARRHVGATQALQGQSVVNLLQDLVPVGATGQALITLERLRSHTMPEQSEGSDAQGRSVLVQCKPFTDLEHAGWLLTLVDLTAMRQTLQQRDQALHFISHDIRAPNASILTLLEMQQTAPGRMSTEELLQRIARYAQASLGMAESFVRLASAQAQDYAVELLDLAALLEETVDGAWALARDRGVEVAITAVPETAPCLGDRSMLGRALANVLNNAIQFSPEGAAVQCAMGERDRHWVVSVRDAGPGIAPDLQDQLGVPFQRLHTGSHPAIRGVGLGLALVRTVVQRHGGALEVESRPGQGAEFRLVLPKEGPAPQGVQPQGQSA